MPEGHVITTAAFEMFLDHNALRSQVTSLLDSRFGDVYEKARRLQKIIETAPLPTSLLAELDLLRRLNDYAFAVRSSATFEDSRLKSWAGQFSSFLDVSPEDLPSFVKRCWASFFSATALMYEAGTCQVISSLGFAVVVQRMLEARVAGVAFSIHPVTKDATAVYLEAVDGSGEALVSGSVTPFSTVLDKRTGNRIPIRGSKVFDILSSAELRQLSELTSEMEASAGVPVDIEWAYEGDTLYLLQARPVTGI